MRQMCSNRMDAEERTWSRDIIQRDTGKNRISATILPPPFERISNVLQRCGKVFVKLVPSRCLGDGDVREVEGGSSDGVCGGGGSSGSLAWS